MPPHHVSRRSRAPPRSGCPARLGVARGGMRIIDGGAAQADLAPDLWCTNDIEVAAKPLSPQAWGREARAPQNAPPDIWTCDCRPKGADLATIETPKEGVRLALQISVDGTLLSVPRLSPRPWPGRLNLRGRTPWSMRPIIGRWQPSIIAMLACAGHQNPASGTWAWSNNCWYSPSWRNPARNLRFCISFHRE